MRLRRRVIVLSRSELVSVVKGVFARLWRRSPRVSCCLLLGMCVSTKKSKNTPRHRGERKRGPSSGNPKHRVNVGVSRAGGVAAVAAAAVALCVMPGAGAVAAAGAPVDTADARVSVATSAGVKSYDFKAGVSPESLGEFLESKGVDPSLVRTSDSKAVDEGQVIHAGDSVRLYAVEESRTESVEEVPFETEVLPSDDLFVGETRVQQAGEPGSVTKVSTVRTDLSKDKSVNVSAVDGADADKSESTVSSTVTKAPVREIVLEGTKPRESAVDSSAVVAGAASGYTLSDEAAGNRAVQLAMSKLGSPYVWGEEGPNAFDCSGLVWWVYRDQLGYTDLPRTAAQQLAYGKRVSVADLKPGMLLASRTHIVIYIGDGKVVHASHPGVGVTVDSLQWALDYGLVPIAF